MQLNRRGFPWYWVHVCAAAVLWMYFNPGLSQVDATPLRATQSLHENWRFIENDELTDEAALRSSGEGWQIVNLPHTWNAVDAASTDLPGSYERGRGWYRLEFATPPAGVRHWLEFGAASLVADVWLNGRDLGEHAGGFTAFRFDVTNVLNRGGTNVLLVKVDNSRPREESDRTAIAPLGGDFNVSGGLYRHVSLISTADGAHFDLADLGGSGVYAATTSIAGGAATVNVRAKVRSDAQTPGEYVVRASLVDAAGQIAATAEQPVSLAGGADDEVVLDLNVTNPRLWNGRADPHLYQLVAEMLSSAGGPIDRVVQSFGVREMRFDPAQGFFLNGQPLRLHGVAMHQDFLGKAWATTNADVDASLALIEEIGANAVRLGHYPFNQYTLQRLSELGIIAWAEAPVGLGTTVERCSTYDATEQYVSNAQQQLREMIRQQYNHAAIATWAVGNESSARQLQCKGPYDNVRPVIRQLHAVAKDEDPTRPTVYAEFDENIGRALPFPMGGITDLLGTNRYYYWYDLADREFEPLLQLFRERYPDQPIGISEYGAGAALTHHTDNPQGGPPEVRSAPEGETSYQPEEYGAYVHEQNWRVISSTPFVWGSFLWNMFDFGSANRNEGDGLGVNTKGIVTFDRQTRKDAFYFYKANWSAEPVTYIVGRRYTDRAYPVADVKVYSNADSVELTVNGASVGVMTADQCDQRTCLFNDVQLVPGVNSVTATGNHAGAVVGDAVEWSWNGGDINIAAGRLASGYVSSTGVRFGSDDFFSGGTGAYIRLGRDASGGAPDVEHTEDPTLFKYFRGGEFSYDIPLKDGAYSVTLGFVEPDREVGAGERIFDVLANGQAVLENVDVVRAAGGEAIAIEKTFGVQVSGGRLTLAFVPLEGKAIVSNLQIRGSTQAHPPP